VANHQNESYSLIAETIAYLQRNSEMPLNEASITEELGIPYTLIDTFFELWAGVGVCDFLKFISLDRTMKVLSNSFSTPTFFDSGDERNVLRNIKRNESFVEIEEMTLEDQKNGGENLLIYYSYQTTIFGAILIANTCKGVCYLGFFDKIEEAFKELVKRFPKAILIHNEDRIQKNALEFFSKVGIPSSPVVLHLKGTEFQFSVWRQLLKIPLGSLTTYGGIAEEIEKPKASRAIGTAIGSNPVAFIIPCHRVVQSTGSLGGYMWGETRKKALIGWEAAQLV